MFNKYLVLLFYALVIALPTPVFAEQKPDVDAGASSYMVYCAACHGAAGKGDGPMVQSLKTAPTDLTTLARTNGGTFPSDKVRAVIDGRNSIQSHGSSEMPIWGDMLTFESTGGGVALDQEPQETEYLVKDRINQLTAYLETLQQK